MPHKTFNFDVNYREGVEAKDFELVNKSIYKSHCCLWYGYYKGLKRLTEQCKNIKRVMNDFEEQEGEGRRIEPIADIPLNKLIGDITKKLESKND